MSSRPLYLQKKMKNWPTEKQVKRQLLVAILSTLAAILDGILMITFLKPIMVFIVIVLFATAVFQWAIYFSIKSQIDIKNILSKENN